MHKVTSRRFGLRIGALRKGNHVRAAAALRGSSHAAPHAPRPRDGDWRRSRAPSLLLASVGLHHERREGRARPTRYASQGPRLRGDGPATPRVSFVRVAGRRADSVTDTVSAVDRGSGPKNIRPEVLTALPWRLFRSGSAKFRASSWAVRGELCCASPSSCPWRPRRAASTGSAK